MSSQEELRRPPVLQITPSERKALQLLAGGGATDEVAISLGVRESELESTLGVLFAALGASSQAEAIAEAGRRGLLPTTTISRELRRVAPVGASTVTSPRTA